MNAEIALACAVPGDCLNGPAPHQLTVEDGAWPCCVQPWEETGTGACRRCGEPVTSWLKQPGVWRDASWGAYCPAGTVSHEVAG